ncbi:ribonucleotide reductase large subunit [Acanthocystis turfacea Chlorella virus MO0605SPH]|nr:ribonucleotide reductase large subunit [Acanthocystis turfacea Chlorella virus MO0605SPH]AGE59990.1 ribonucleotide reductase large subunit [Acanthocystis turfacea Chlorella virus WI0606]
MNKTMRMNVIKRDGSSEAVSFDKIMTRIGRLCWAENAKPNHSGRVQNGLEVDISRIVASICSSVVDNITTVQLDDLTADKAASMVTNHPDYGILAARIAVSNLHKQSSDSVVDTYTKMSSMLSDEFMQVVRAHEQEFQALVKYDRDYDFDYFGFSTMKRLYLTKVDGKVVERPQHTYLRVAIALWGEDTAKVKETYDALSKRKFTHASPTLFNAGFRNANLASCFLVHVDDSLTNIFKSLGDVAQLSKFGGGIGLHLSDIRGRGSKIQGTNGESDGIVPMLKVYDTTSAYANQGGRRKGSFAVYLEPHHPDIMDFLLLRRNQGEETQRARNLFYAMWLNDLFMKRVEADVAWSLFDPKECPGLTDAFGKEYEDLYLRYESEGRAKKVVKARDVWNAMIITQIETGMPYVLNKDSVNVKNMQSNAGTIKGSNLCAEIVEYTSTDETAVCVIGSIVLQNYVKNGAYDFEDLRKHVKILTKNLDKSIDVMSYAIPEAKTSNMRRRPIGVGVQGLQDVFFKLRMPFDSDAAKNLNREIFENIYFAAVEASCELAEEHGPHPTFEGSPASRGVMQYHLWGTEPVTRLDWKTLEERVKKGVRNSLTTALMPTASTAQICGSVEAMEPITSNLYSRRTLAGEFPVVNNYLVRDLIARGTWSEAMKNQIIANGGSIQRVIGIHPELKAIYKTAWELSMKTVIDLAADRGPFVDQTQSMNLFVAAPSMKSMSSMLFYAWKKGLKTLMYYCRSKPAANAIAVTVGEECLACSA